jgi:hypothetical protein
MSSGGRNLHGIDQLDEHARELLRAAQQFQSAAGARDSSATAPAALGRLEKALQALSTGWYQAAADAAPGVIERRERRKPRASGRPSSSPGGGLSHEQEARLMATLHEVAAAFGQCARACRDGRSTVAPLLARRAPDQLNHRREAPSGDWRERPAQVA